MIRRTFARFIVCGLLALALTAAPALAADSYASDTAHSSVNFRVMHLGIGYVFGRFNTMDARFTLDGQNSSFNVTIKAESIDTGNAQRDKHLKTDTFFNAAQFPDITFKSTAVKVVDGGYEVTGDLMLHGVTKPVTIKLEKTGEGLSGKERVPHVGFYSQFTVKRGDFGMNKMSGPTGIGDEVTLMVAIDGGKQ